MKGGDDLGLEVGLRNFQGSGGGLLFCGGLNFPWGFEFSKRKCILLSLIKTVFNFFPAAGHFSMSSQFSG